MNNERKDETQSIYTIGSQKNLVPIRSRHAYLKRQSQVPNLLVIILIFMVASLLVIVIVLSILYARSTEKSKLCDSEDCVRIAASLKESMDTSVDPCDDFYKYTCGRWSKEHPIPDSSLTNSWFSERTERVSRKIRELLRKNITKENAPWAVSQAKILYTSCLDVEAMDDLGLTPLFELLEDLGLPSIPAAFSKKTGNYVEQMAAIKRILGKDVFFGLNVLPDPRNKSRNIMLLDTPAVTNPLPNDKELEKRLQSIKSRLRSLEGDTTEEETNELVDVEINYMMDVIRQILTNGTADACSFDNQTNFPTDAQLKEAVETIYEISNTFYYLIATESNETVSEADLSDSNYMLVEELQKLTDEYVTAINASLAPRALWRPFIELVFKDIVSLDLDKTDRILVGNLAYLKDVAYALAVAEEEDMETFIWWTVVETVVPHLSENLRGIWTKYIDQLMSVEVGESKSLYCASAVNQLMVHIKLERGSGEFSFAVRKSPLPFPAQSTLLAQSHREVTDEGGVRSVAGEKGEGAARAVVQLIGMAVSWLFVDPSFHENQGAKVREMLEDIRHAFATLVMNADWMDKKTKVATLEKNRKMASEIGFPKWLFEEGALDDYYEGIDLSETTYLDNMVQIVGLMSTAELECVHDINYSNESYWATDPTDVNAFHTFQVNQITIPAGILQFPFYELGLEALNYGAIGTVLGHELTHGFDNSGRHYDSNGNLRQWWTNETINEYTDRTGCFIKHYSSYYEDEVDDYIDGELTLGENIADNGGLREAVIAYKKWKARHGQEPFLPGFTHLTHEQLVFLGFAHLWCESYTVQSLKWMLQDSHCPGHIRLQAVLKNSKEFSEVWKCPVGSNMNPSNKCHLW